MAVELAPVLALLGRDIPGLAGVYLFGSEAQGAARAGSDVDLALYAGRTVDAARLLEARHGAAALLRREVDLVDLAAADTVLQMQVLRDGKLLLAPDPSAVGFFELRVLRDYRDLKRRRAGIEADIAARGWVNAG